MKKFTLAEILYCLDLRAQGKSFNSIGAAVGRTAATISKKFDSLAYGTVDGGRMISYTEHPTHKFRTIEDLFAAYGEEFSQEKQDKMIEEFAKTLAS